MDKEKNKKNKLLNYITNKVKKLLSYRYYKNISLVMIIKTVSILISYLFTLFVTRLYGPEVWGLFALSLMVVSFLRIISVAGFDTVILKYISIYSDNNLKEAKLIYYKALVIVVPISLVLSFLNYFLANNISLFIFNKESVIPYLKIISFCITPVSLITINAQALRGIGKIKEFAFYQYSGKFSGALVVLFILYVINYRIDNIVIYSFAIGVYLIAIISSLTILSFFRKNANTKKLIKDNQKVSYLELIKVSLPMLLASSAFFIKGWIDTFMLGVFVNEEMVGLYNVAFKLSSFISLSLIAVNSIAASDFARYFHNNEMAKFNRVVNKSTKTIFYLSAPFLISFILFPKYFLSFFGREFENAYLVLILLSFGQFINAISGSIGYVLQMTGKQGVYKNIQIFVIILSITLNYLLIPLMGIVGAALTTLVVQIFWNGLCIIYIKMKYDILTIYFPFKERLINYDSKT